MQEAAKQAQNNDSINGAKQWKELNTPKSACACTRCHMYMYVRCAANKCKIMLKTLHVLLLSSFQHQHQRANFVLLQKMCVSSISRINRGLHKLWMYIQYIYSYLYTYISMYSMCQCVSLTVLPHFLCVAALHQSESFLFPSLSAL